MPDVPVISLYCVITLPLSSVSVCLKVTLLLIPLQNQILALSVDENPALICVFDKPASSVNDTVDDEVESPVVAK